VSSVPPEIAAKVVDWLLRRLRQGTRLDHDLVLMSEHPALAELSTSIEAGGERWRVARVTGELTLRAALPEADKLLAIVPAGMMLPKDIQDRAYLGRAQELRPEDLVAALAGRFCEPLLDEALGQAVFDALDLLAERAGQWSLTGVVTAREVRSVLVAAELGADQRLDRERDWELLATWIVEGLPSFRAPTLVAHALAEAQPRSGHWLAWAVTEGSLPELLAAGALVGSAAGRAVAPELPGSRDRSPSDLRSLVELAVRAAWKTDPERTLEALAEAERRAHKAQLSAADAVHHPLLRGALEAAMHELAFACVQGDPPDQSLIERLHADLHAPSQADALELLEELARLARFAVQPHRPPADASAWCWLRYALHHVGWVDLSLRRLRRGIGAAPTGLAEAAQAVLERTVALRDALNREAAERLALEWPQVASSKDLRQPLPLHQVSRSLLQRLLLDGHRVLLLVLDGCDLSTFFELMESLPKETGVGLVAPSVHNATLRGDLMRMGAPLGVALSPVPTVTSHARRALFAGDSAGNSALDDTEAHAANASADKVAWSRNKALGDTPRTLFLKGDLGPSCTSVLQALEDANQRLLAVVLNGVDDALASHETTAIPPWTWAGLGPGSLAVLRTAVQQGWTVVLTADHGHTPFLDKRRHQKGRGHAPRFAVEAVADAVKFDAGPLPASPLWASTKLGAYRGQQRRGFHGGAGLEEVAVPLAFLGSVESGLGRPAPPSWWWSMDTEVEAPPEPEAPRQESPPPSAGSSSSGPTTPSSQALPVDLRSLLAERPDALRGIEAIAQHGVLDLSQLARIMNRPAFLVGGMMGTVQQDLVRAGIPVPFTEEGEGGERIYRWKTGS